MWRWWMFAEFLEPEHGMTLGGVRHCCVGVERRYQSWGISQHRLIEKT